MTIGTLIAFTGLQAGIFRPLMGLLDVGASWITSMALFSRIFGYLDLSVDVAPPANPVAIDLASLRGDVRFEHVSHTYDGQTYAADDVTLDVPAGTTLALVGETGSGKSTLAGLVSRLADPTRGRVTIDGVDLRDLVPEDLARTVGAVTQETYLVHASIRENLLLASPEATDDELWRALEAAQVAALVAGLPTGLDTVVGARGHRFSGGEKQRLAIARTLLRNPRVLVLDEATSALDNETERELQTALDRLMAGRTTITVAHRLSTIRGAEQIAVLDRGRVVELGDHDSLLALGGRYSRLTESRAETASPEVEPAAA
jgi:ATP-binding cassette subfamily B protein